MESGNGELESLSAEISVKALKINEDPHFHTCLTFLYFYMFYGLESAFLHNMIYILLNLTIFYTLLKEHSNTRYSYR